MPEELPDQATTTSERKTLGYEYMQAGRFLEAVKVFTMVLVEAPEDPEVYCSLGHLYHKMGDDKLAFLMYGQAKRIRPNIPGIAVEMSKLGMPDYLSPSNVREPIPNEIQEVGGMLQQMTRRDGPISDEEIERAAKLLKMILTSPQPGQVVAEHLEEVDALLPALIELNIRQAQADGQPELAEGLKELLVNLQIQMEQRGQTDPSNGQRQSSGRWVGGAHSGRTSPHVLILNRDVADNNPRLALVAESLTDQGCRVHFADDESTDLSEKPDVVLVNNPHTSAEMMQQMAVFAAANIPIIYDLDRDFEEMPANHPNYERFGLGNLNNARGYMASLMLASQVTVPCNAMAGALSMARCPVHVLPDGWSQTNDLWMKPSPRRSTLNLGWVGLPGHVDDVATIKRLVIRIMREFVNTQLVIAGDDKVFQLFDTLPESRKVYLPATSVEESPFTYAQIDLMFAPLRNIPFNRAQSDQNLVHAGVRQIPWVASPVPAYEEWAMGGMIADTTEKWYDSLHQLAANEELRAELGLKGYIKAQQREKRTLGSAWLNLVQECLGSSLTVRMPAFMDD